MRAVGAVVGGLCGLIAMYITYAANGCSYDNTGTKGATMATVIFMFAFVLGFLRFRYKQYWFAFVVAIFR